MTRKDKKQIKVIRKRIKQLTAKRTAVSKSALLTDDARAFQVKMCRDELADLHWELNSLLFVAGINAADTEADPEQFIREHCMDVLYYGNFSSAAPCEEKQPVKATQAHIDSLVSALTPFTEPDVTKLSRKQLCNILLKFGIQYPPAKLTLLQKIKHICLSIQHKFSS